MAAVVVALCAALILLALRHAKQEANWPCVPGTVQETRVVLADWIPGSLRVNPQPVWRAEYKVAYSADGREYASWFDGGIRGETKRFVEIRANQMLGTPGFSCNVKYNPAQPGVSVADCQ